MDARFRPSTDPAHICTRFEKKYSGYSTAAQHSHTQRDTHTLLRVTMTHALQYIHLPTNTFASVLILIASIISQTVTAQHPFNQNNPNRNDSATFNAYLRNVCNGTTTGTETGTSAVPQDVVIDLTGTVLALDAPILIDHTVRCSGTLRIKGGTFAALPGLATNVAANHSFLVEVLGVWTGLGVYFEQNVFASNHIGGGLRVDASGHVHVYDGNFLDFKTVGIWGSKLLSGMGHDLTVERCRLTECTKAFEECADIRGKTATVSAAIFIWVE